MAPATLRHPPDMNDHSAENYTSNRGRDLWRLVRCWSCYYGLLPLNQPHYRIGGTQALLTLLRLLRSVIARALWPFPNRAGAARAVRPPGAIPASNALLGHYPFVGGIRRNVEFLPTPSSPFERRIRGVIVPRQDDEAFEPYQECHHLAVIAFGHLQSVPTTDPEFRYVRRIEEEKCIGGVITSKNLPKIVHLDLHFYEGVCAMPEGARPQPSTGEPPRPCSSWSLRRKRTTVSRAHPVIAAGAPGSGGRSQRDHPLHASTS